MEGALLTDWREEVINHRYHSAVHTHPQVNEVFPDETFFLLVLVNLLLLHESTFFSFLSNRNSIMYSF